MLSFLLEIFSTDFDFISVLSLPTQSKLILYPYIIHVCMYTYIYNSSQSVCLCIFLFIIPVCIFIILLGVFNDSGIRSDAVEYNICVYAYVQILCVYLKDLLLVVCRIIIPFTLKILMALLAMTKCTVFSYTPPR